MKNTKIDWADMSWNPVTGCRHGCPYCYARRTAERFATPQSREERADPAHQVSDHVLYTQAKREPYPYGFEPTFHPYRLEQLKKEKNPRTIFVCSMADLFGDWVPVEWIVQVLDTCQDAPWHRYLFLTKNPKRYLELDHMALLPHGENFWYGSTVTGADAVAMFPMPWSNINSFWSMEPLLGPVELEPIEGVPNWVIIGAETGKQPNKTVPKLEWVESITKYCAENEIPVFYKDNIRSIYPDLPPSAFPWGV